MSRTATVVIGANGALGTDLMEILEYPVPATHDDFDITDLEATRAFLTKVRPRSLINTAAYHQVPACEEHYQIAFQVNAIGVRNLAVCCKQLGIHLCHISTDYVFDGSKKAPYVEDDLPAPVNTYAISKLAGEYMLKAYGGANTSIVRSCGLYGAIPTRAKGGNFITNMVHLGRTRERVTVVDDEIVAPTYTLDLARAIDLLLAAQGRGIFHLTQSGATSWYGFAKVIFKVLGLPAELVPIKSSEFQTKVARPSYSILDNSRFNGLTGHPMRHWETAVRDHLRDMKARGHF